MKMNDLLMDAMSKRASDLHLMAGSPPVLRIDGELHPQTEMTAVTPDEIEQLFTSVTNDEQQRRFNETLELDFAHGVAGMGRFRANACMQRGTIGLCFRLLQPMIPDIEELGLPEICKDLSLKERGLILITGPAGSGKSTTLAVMIKYLNSLRRRRIITIEDPIEFLFHNDKCFITQREIGTDTLDFAAALKHALRQDPNVVMLGEMRDLETISIALTAAETGHLILATLHTPSAPQAIDRMIDIFPPYQQQQARIQLSTVIEGVLYQSLIPKKDGVGRVAAVEVMIATDAIKNLIREARTAQMWSMMQTGAHFGMQTMDQSLLQLYHQGFITLEEALSRCREPETAKKSLARTGAT
jgi:twitching motility protein PilT